MVGGGSEGEGEGCGEMPTKVLGLKYNSFQSAAARPEEDTLQHISPVLG